MLLAEWLRSGARTRETHLERRCRSTRPRSRGHDLSLRLRSPGDDFSRDPIEEEGGVNLYAFVDAEPIGKIDPAGQYVFYTQKPPDTEPLVWLGWERGTIPSDAIDVHCSWAGAWQGCDSRLKMSWRECSTDEVRSELTVLGLRFRGRECGVAYSPADAIVTFTLYPDWKTALVSQADASRGRAVIRFRGVECCELF